MCDLFLVLRCVCVVYLRVADVIRMGPPPVVSGISPREGPPGTKITIRGENLGISPQVTG